MILGGEQPVALPTMSWYDKDAFKMYIAAAKDDYDKNIEEQKDFLNKYIDMAATDKDREYMANNVINPVVQFVQNNPEAIRSVQGRAMLRQLRNAIDPEKIARIKGTAKTADMYNKAMAEMIANGTYSEDMQKVMGVDLSSWDSAQNGAFQQVAPYKLEHIEDLLLPTIKQLGNAYKYNEALTKQRHDGKRYSTVSDQQVYDAFNGDYVDLLQKPSMKYHLQKYLQSNPGKTEKDFKNELFEQVRGQLGEKTEKDELYFNNLTFKQQVALENLKHQHAKQRAEEEVAAKNNSLYPQKSSTLAMESNEKFNATSDVSNNTGYFVNYFTALSKTAKNNKDKATYTRFANEWKQYNGLSNNKKHAFLRKYGYVDDNNKYTKKYYKYLGDAVKAGGYANGYVVGKKGNLMALTTPEVTVNNALNFVDRSSTRVGKQTVDAALDVKYNKIGGYYQFSFNNAGGRMTSVDAMNAQGIKRHRNNRYDLANNWLRTSGIVGNVFNTSEARQRTGNGKITFSNVEVTVPIEKLDGLVSYLRSHGVRGDHSQILAKVGIRAVDNRNNEVSTETVREDYKNRQSHSTSTKKTGTLYARIPATFDLSGDDEITNFNNQFTKSNTSNKYTHEEYPNAYEASDDVK